MDISTLATAVLIAASVIIYFGFGHLWTSNLLSNVSTVGHNPAEIGLTYLFLLLSWPIWLGIGLMRVYIKK